MCLINMKSKQSFQFEHEKNKRPETKVPKYQVKYAKGKKGKSKTETTVQTETERQVASQEYTLGEAPANVYSPSTYSPLLLTPSTDRTGSFFTASPISPILLSSTNSISSTNGSPMSPNPIVVPPPILLSSTNSISSTNGSPMNIDSPNPIVVPPSFSFGVWNGQGSPTFKDAPELSPTQIYNELSTRLLTLLPRNNSR